MARLQNGRAITTVAALFLAVSAGAQEVIIKYTPDPMAIVTSVIANAHDIGRWTIEVCNNGNVPVTIPWERISMAAPSIRFLSNTDAALNLNSKPPRTFWGQVGHYGSIGAEAAALGLAVANSRGNAAWITGLSIGGMVAPGITQIAQQQIPSVAPLLQFGQYPVTLSPNGTSGSCFTDYRYAAKMHGVAVVIAVINLATDPLPSPQRVNPSTGGADRRTDFPVDTIVGPGIIAKALRNVGPRYEFGSHSEDFLRR